MLVLTRMGLASDERFAGDNLDHRADESVTLLEALPAQ